MMKNRHVFRVRSCVASAGILLFVVFNISLYPVVVRVEAASLPQCSDGIDNDMDGKVDYPADPGCISANGAEEFSYPAVPITTPVAGGLTNFPVRALGPNLLTNAGFEQLDANGKVSGWTSGGGGVWGQTGFFVSSSTAHTGLNSVELKDSNLTPYADSFYQDFPIHKGVYQLSGWVKMSGLAAAQGTSGRGARISVGPVAYGAPGGSGATVEVKGTSDWQYIERNDIVITQDISGRVQISALSSADGIAWFDDLQLRESLAPAIDVFMLYPNYRGYLFDDQSQIMKFDVRVTPPAGTSLANWRVQADVQNESNHAVTLTQIFPSSADFTATLNGAALSVGSTYLVRFKLIDADGSAVYEYPAYRVSKVSGAARSAMAISFDENNRILFNGQPKFLLGVYDSGLGYNSTASSFEGNLITNRHLFELPINFYLNYWYGSMPVSSVQALVTALQWHGASYVSTANCFAARGQFTDFPSQTNNTFMSGLAGINGLGGMYVMDECSSDLAAGEFLNTQRFNSFKPDGINLAVGNQESSLFYWRDVADLLAMDPYPLYGAEPAGGYPFNQVADLTQTTKAAVQGARPVATVLQYFKMTSSGRWPTQAELRNMSYMAIANGANGLMYWSIGTNALAYICDGSDAYHSPSGGASWCQAKIDKFNDLKAVMSELNTLQPVLSSVDRGGLLMVNSSAQIRTRVKYLDGNAYLIASNYSSSTIPATFTWSQAPVSVSVYNESRSLTPSGSGFTDSFAPYQAHVYVVSMTGSPAAPADTTPPTVPAGLSATAMSASQIALTWNISTDAGGSVAGYQVYRNGVPLNTTRNTSYTDTGLTAGTSYSYAVAAYDAAGNYSARSASVSATTPVVVSLDTTLPTVSLTAPAVGATLSGVVPLTATASDNVGVTSVEFLVDSVLLQADTTSPYAASLDTSRLTNGPHQITARATDAAGNSMSSSVSVTVQNAAAPVNPSGGSGGSGGGGGGGGGLSAGALTLSNVRVNAASTQATISWTTNIPSTGGVSLGLSTTYATGSSTKALTLDHSFTFTNLSRATTYHYSVFGTSQSGMFVSLPDATFVTSGQSTSTLSPTSTKISMPANIQISFNPFTLAWSQGDAASVKGWAVLRSATAYPTSSALASRVTSPKFSDTTAVPGSVYFYSIWAYDDQGHWSDPAQVLAIVAPQNTTDATTLVQQLQTIRLQLMRILLQLLLKIQAGGV